MTILLRITSLNYEPNKNNVIRHHAFGRETQSITYTNYEWKKSVPSSIKKSYNQNFGQLNKLDKVEIYE